MGAPNSIRDADIFAALPVLPGPSTNTTMFAIHVKISRDIGSIVNSKLDLSMSLSYRLLIWQLYTARMVA